MRPIKTILAPTDFSDCGNAAAAYAVRLAAQVHGSVVLVHILGARRRDDERAAAFRDEALAELHQLAEQIARPEVAIRCRATYGLPAGDIPQLAEEEGADLIVVGTHGRSGLWHLFLGSVTEAVLRASRIPVLAVGRTVTAIGGGEVARR